MRAARFKGSRTVEVVEVPRPKPGPGELLVRVAANGVCGSDRKVFLNGRANIPGHEAAGTVVEVGAGCSTPVGARIAAYLPLFCGQCPFCERGAGNLCPDGEGLLGWSTDGGYAEYMLVPEQNALSLHDDLSFAQGVLLLDTLGTAGHAVRLAGGRGAESALVLGAGPIGAGALACLKAFGVEELYVSEPSGYRRRIAAEMGAVPIDPETEEVAERVLANCPYGVDLAVEAAGRLETVWQGLDLVRPGGKVAVAGEYWGPVELDHPKGEWMFKDLTVIRSFYFPLPEFEQNQRMIRHGRIRPNRLITHTFPLERIGEGLQLFFSGRALKVMIEP